MINFDRFTRKGAGIIGAAVAEAEALGHTYVGSEHLLLALASGGGSRAAEILNRYDLSYAGLRREIIRTVGQGTPSVLSAGCCTAAARRVLDNACAIAKTEKKKQTAPLQVFRSGAVYCTAVCFRPGGFSPCGVRYRPSAAPSL